MVKKRAVKTKTKKKVRAKRTVVKHRPKAKRKGIRKPPAKKKGAIPQIEGLTLEKIGDVTHYFPKVKAAAVMILKNSLKAGDEVYVKGHTTDFREKVLSIQLDRVPVAEGKRGEEIGLLVKSRVRIGDSVYKIKVK